MIKRKIQRIIFHLMKFFIGFVVYIDGRFYMRLFNWLLKKNGVTINGKPRFIARSVKFDDFDKIILNDRLVISMNVHFLTHDYSYTTSLISIGEKPITDVGIIRGIEVGENVFIGLNSILLPGTKIGNNVIVGAGSVVRGNVPDFSIIAGNPAKIISDIRDYAKKVKNRENQNLRIDKK